MAAPAESLIEARFEAKLAEQRGDIKLNTQGLADLKDRFGDLSALMSTVPADIATLKERVAHLPTKDELSAKLRAYLTLAVGIIGLMIGAATLAIRYLPVAASAST